MDLKMGVYTPGLELIGVLEKYKSVIWEDKAFTAGSFSVDALLTDETRPLLAEENIIWLEGTTAGIIEHYEKSAENYGTYITVKGRLLTGILDRRILWGLYNLSGTAPAAMEYLANDCAVHPTRGDTAARVIPGLVISGGTAGGASIQKQVTGGSLLDALEEIGRTYKVAFGVRFNPAVPRMEFWTRPCADRGIHQSRNAQVFYSTELDDVLSSAYSYNSIDWRNVALVAGEGEGADRKTVVVEGDVPDTPDVPVPPPAPVLRVTITLSVDPAGGGAASGGGKVDVGTKVSVTAFPSGGYEFVEWRENGQAVSRDRTYTFTANIDRALTAVFAAVIPVYVVAVSIDPPGGGTVQGGGSYEQGKSVTLTQTTADGYRFTGWYNAAGTQLGAGDTYTFTPTENITITAKYAAIPVYAISAAVDPSGSGSVTGAGQYRENQTATLQAAPNDGYNFTEWKENGSTVHNTADYSFTVNKNRDLVATFAEIPASRLPAGYKEVEYISNGTNSNANYRPYFKMPGTSSAVKMEIKLELGSKYTTASAYRSIFGQASSATQGYALAVIGGNLVHLYGTTRRVLVTGYSENVPYAVVFDYTNKQIEVDGRVVISSTPGTDWRTNANYLFGPLGYIQSYTGIKIYSLRMWNTNGDLVLEFVPCINPSGIAGMYDTIGKKFYSKENTSSSAENFIPGPVV